MHLFTLVSKAEKKPKVMPYITLRKKWDRIGTVCEESIIQHHQRNSTRSTAKKEIHKSELAQHPDTPIATNSTSTRRVMKRNHSLNVAVNT